MNQMLNKEIGLRIREKREEAKLTRDQLAEVADISPQFLAQIELGNKGMSHDTLCKICLSLSVSADYILLGRKNNNDISSINEILLNLDPKFLPYAEDLLRTFILAINK